MTSPRASHTPSPVGKSDASETNADALFLQIVERDPRNPGRALAAFLAERSRTEELVRALEQLLREYERGGIADPDEAHGGEAIERALASVAAQAPEPVSTAIPTRLGNYRILRTLSLGPSSAVLLAEQEAPIQREVAIKLLFEDASDTRLAARVELERQTLASLEHPNIARIYDYGIAPDHRPYMVMEHVGGGNIVDYCRGAKLPLRERVELFLEACAAIRTAHTLGVLHCDLKPANVLVQVVVGEPHAKVIDFGIARTVRAAGGERAQLAELPRALGTLASMSPEALVPGGAPLDTRADVFGLGLVLLELATLQQPRSIPRDDIGEALRIVLEDPIPRASQLAAASGQRADPDFDADLDAVIAKATARDKRERYDSVDAFMRDLASWLDGGAVTARVRPLAERVRRSVMRRRLAILLAAAALLAVVPLVSREFEADAARNHALDAANAALAALREIRDLPGTDDRRATLVTTVAEETRAGLLSRPGDVELMKARAAGVEEELLARLMRGDQKSQRSRELGIEAERMRREIVKLQPNDLVALADLSVALAYKLDTIRDEPGFIEAQTEQIAIDIELHERDPKSRLFADNLSWTYQRVADRAWERNERERALEYLDKSAELGDIALALEPSSSVSLFTAAAGHIYAMHADLVRGDRPAAEAHVLRSLELSGALLAREPQHPRVGAFHLRAASFAAGFVYKRESAREAEEILNRALAAVARNEAAKQNIVFMSYPYIDVLHTRVLFALVAGDGELAAARAGELRALVDRIRYADLRPSEFSAWDSTLTATEAWLALHRGDFAAAEQLIARAFDVARLYATGIGSRLSDLSGVVGRISHALELESKRGVDTATRERFEAIRAWVVSELEKDIAEAERTVPESPSVLSAKRARAKLLGDTEGANEYDDKIFGAPNTTYQQAAIGPPWTKRE